MENDLEDLLAEKMNMLFRYLKKLGVNHSDIQDILQETMIKLWSYIGEVPHDKLNSWLFRVTLNQYYDYLRKQKRLSPEPIDFAIIIGSDEEQPETLMVSKEQREEFEVLLTQLKPEYKHVLLLRYQLEMSYREIAQTLDVKEERVKTWLFRAKNQFKKVYLEGK